VATAKTAQRAVKAKSLSDHPRPAIGTVSGIDIATAVVRRLVARSFSQGNRTIAAIRELSQESPVPVI